MGEAEGDPESEGRPGAEGPSLADLQAWFGRAISRPLPADYRGNPLAAGSPELREAGDSMVKGAGGLSGFDRVGIYNQQYWFRLISVMQEEYPCAVHVMGLKAFNARVIRYLDAHPPSSPYLARLDEAWPGFLREDYREPNREAALQAVDYDRAFSRAVDSPDGRPLGSATAGGVVRHGEAGFKDPMTLRLALAPHASALNLDWDFPAYRPLCLADQSLEASLDPEPARMRLLIWRGVDGALWQKPLSAAAWKVLRELREGVTLPEAFARLEGHLDAGERAELEAGLAGWFAEWTREGILVLAP